MNQESIVDGMIGVPRPGSAVGNGKHRVHWWARNSRVENSLLSWAEIGLEPELENHGSITKGKNEKGKEEKKTRRVGALCQISGWLLQLRRQEDRY
jgi:hypothetical protein